MHREQEFRDLFADECALVVRTVYAIVGDAGRAEEITQDAFTQLLRHWNKVSSYDRPEAWVRRVAIRLAVKLQTRELRLAGALIRLRPAPVAMPGPDVEVSGEVLAAMRQLTAKQRAVVVLFYFEDRPITEIAQIVDCSDSAVEMRLHRARERLAELLGEEVDSHVR
jgi:RNA polymerase sigma factor (sigma-70 family)